MPGALRPLSRRDGAFLLSERVEMVCTSETAAVSDAAPAAADDECAVALQSLAPERLGQFDNLLTESSAHLGILERTEVGIAWRKTSLARSTLLPSSFTSK